MRRCLICNATFGDDDRFCHNDGSVLVDEYPANAPTVAFETPPTMPSYSPALSVPTTQIASASSAAKWMMPVIGVLCGLVVILGFFAFYRQAPTAEADKKETELVEKKSETVTSPARTPVTPPPSPLASEPDYLTGTVDSPRDGFLALRSDPCVAPCGRTILKIPHGTLLSFQTCKDYYEVADGRRGKWCYVTYGESSGWVFDGFVKY